MIKKISQLNRLPAKFYDDEVMDNTEDRLRKKKEMLFEVSYETADTSNPSTADEINYYTSYSITLSALENMLDVDELKETISAIVDGGLSVISGELKIGQEGLPISDRLSANGHVYHPDQNSEHFVDCYSRFNLENNLLVHGTTEFHNDVVITCDTNINRQNPILTVKGVSKFYEVIDGTAYRAQWGDLAEIYAADKKYEPGTLIMFGGEKEITIAKEKVNGVVTSNPAIILNNNECEKMEIPTGVALVGRVPIKVRGPVHKFDKIVLSRTDPGIGVVYNHAYPTDVIARTLEENKDPGEKLVLCVTKMNLI